MMEQKQTPKKSNSITYGTDFSFEVGKIVGFRGLKGELKVKPATNSPHIFLDLQSVVMGQEKNATIYSVASINLKDRSLTLTLQEFSDRNSVESLKGKTIYTQVEQLLELDEDTWWSKDLIGLKAQDLAGLTIGVVSDVYGADGEFLEVCLDKNGEKKLVPFVSEIVPEVDIEKGIVRLNAPDGLFD